MRSWTKEIIHAKCVCIPAVLILFLSAAGCGNHFPDKASREDGFFKASESEEDKDMSTGQKSGTEGKETSVQDAGAEDQMVYVHVCGQVKKPGLYSFPAGTRAGDAVEAAGGFTKKADADAVNLAALIEDGQQIYVPDESETGDRQERISPKKAENDVFDGTKEEKGSADDSDGGDRININTADLEDLTSLTGIGESKGAAIIEYREKNGAFSSKEEIRNVPGIGDGIYNRIKALITV